ncbi:hypothetical protein TNCV_2372651 [Trichonephila clavipes]|nr:hypothetical protein TNCV_2372651 [Trichonephila clavipes]
MALKLNLKKNELILVAVEMGLVIPSKAKIIDLKKLMESSAVYKNDIEFVRSLVENGSEKNCFCLRPHNSLIHFSRDKTRNPTPTSNLNLDAPTFVPGQIKGSVEANSQSQFVVTGFEKGRLKRMCF